jgi:prepilin-type N-terminal cleavage/methylation domain-containing protein
MNSLSSTASPLSSPRRRGSSAKESRGADAPHWIPACAGMTKNDGFSLVELSIVLVILGLLVGGILAGQSLIRAAEMRSVSTDYQRYTASAQTFRDKYFAIPGDMPNATAFWGDRATGTAACPDATIPNGSPGTCNGTGNAIIDAGNEWWLFWQHLQMSGLIEGTYTGVVGSGGGQHHEIGVNCPKGKMPNSGWAVAYVASGGPGDGATFALIDYGNYLMIGSASSNDRPFNRLMRPEEAWNIDTKLDDGRPAYGTVIARYWNDECSAADDGTSAANDLNASYRLTDSGIRCALNFVRIF